MNDVDIEHDLHRKMMPTQTDLWRERADNPEARHHLVLSIPPIYINKNK